MLGVKDVDRKILLELDDRSLLNACQTDSRYAKLCSNDEFWRIRYIQQFGEHAAQYKPENVTWRNHYLQVIVDLENFPGLTELSEMIIWDTQGDWKSSYWVDTANEEIKPFTEAPEKIMNWFWLKKIDEITLTLDFWDENASVSSILKNVTPQEIYEEMSKESDPEWRFITGIIYSSQYDDYQRDYRRKHF